MSPAHVIAPTYEAIKHCLMTGEWAGGARLEAVRLADLLGVSITPVRDSLYRLAGERMVDFVHGDGFHVHRLTETEYRDMLELNLVLLIAALASGPGVHRPPPDMSLEAADRSGVLFHGVAVGSGNEEISATVAALNDRLHLSRRLEPSLLGDTGPEIAAIEAALRDTAAPGEIRHLLMRYHERRAREAGNVARLLASAANRNPASAAKPAKPSP